MAHNQISPVGSVAAHNTFGDRVKRFLGIDPEERFDDSAYFDDGSFIEDEVSARDFFRGIMPTGSGVANYFRELFPFLGWIFHYNLTWLLGDFIAGKSDWWPCGERAIANRCRRHGRFRCRAPGYGVCIACSAPSRVWPVHILRRILAVLGVCDVQGHHHRCECIYDAVR